MDNLRHPDICARLMDAEKKMAFVHRMTRLGLQHFDTGGGVTNAQTGSGYGLPGPGGGGVLGPGLQGEYSPGSLINGLSNDLTTQNSFGAVSPTSAGTVGSQQAGLYSELANEAAGNGPNPAQQQYLQNTGQIAQQQAQTYAQNRSLNPAVAARLSGNQAAGLQNQAASTAGIQQAEQQLTAQGQLGQLTGQEQQGALAAQGINAQISQNNANAVNATESGVLGGVGSTLTGGLFAYGGPTNTAQIPGEGEAAPDTFIDESYYDNQPDYSDYLNGTADPSKQKKGGLLSGNQLSPAKGSIQSPYAPNISNANQVGMKAGPGPSGVLSGIGSIAALGAGAKGGLSKDLHKIALIMHPEHFCGGGTYPPVSGYNQGGVPPYAGQENKFMSNYAKGGGNVKAKNASEKAVKKGDDYKNDKVPAMLSEGELVIDRETMQDKGPAGKMARALAAHIKARNSKKGER